MTDITIMAKKIKERLEAVAGVQQAFDYEPDTINRLPAATVFFDGFSQVEGTSMKNQLNWQWIIRLYIPIRTSDIKAPQVEVRTLVQNTLKAFRSDITLGNTCYYHTISNGDIFAMLEQNNPMIVAELTLVATTEEYL